MFAKTASEAGCHWSRVYRSEREPNDELWLMEWKGHDAFNKSGDETGEQFNALVDPAGNWEQVVWQLSDVEQALLLSGQLLGASPDSPPRGDIYDIYL